MIKQMVTKIPYSKCTNIAIGNENMDHSFEIPSEDGDHQVEQV